MSVDAHETYFDRAWSDLVSNEDWWKAIFAFGLVNCIPIAGQIIVFGYLFDWAKEAAWGMNVPLARQLGSFSRRLKYGFMTLWVMIIWVAPVLIIAWLTSFIPVVGGVICFALEILAVVVCSFAAAGAMRSMIYEHVTPGIQVKKVFKMARKDPGGLAQSFCIILLLIPLTLAALFILLIPVIPFIHIVATTTLSSALGADLAILIFLGMITMVVALVVWVTCAIISALIFALYVRSLGYWIERFDPADWKSPDAPMPFEQEMAAEKEAKAAAKKAAKDEKKRAKKEAKPGKKQAKEEPKPNDD